ncbi:unnamed protein product, partial [marine sediment metagenome]
DPVLLDAYRALVVLGDITLSDEWLSSLEGYVRAGGKVLVNAAHVPAASWPDWLGCRPTGVQRSSSHFCWAEQPPQRDYPFEFPEVKPHAAAVLASAPDGSPLVLANHVGKGEVWLTTPSYLIGQSELLTLGRRVFEQFLRPFDPVRIDGPPLAHIVNRRSNGDLLITLGNESSEQWIGGVFVPDAAWCEGRARDLWNDRGVIHYAEGNYLVLSLVLPPWGLAVIEVKRS